MLTICALLCATLAQAPTDESSPGAGTGPVDQEGTAEPPSWLVLDPVGSDLIPPAPWLAPGLPEPLQVQGGVLLPDPLDVALAQLLRYCRHGYPAAVAVAVRRTSELEAERCDGRLEVERARCRRGQVVAEVETSGRWRTWEVVLGGAVVATVAAGLGYLAGAQR